MAQPGNFTPILLYSSSTSTNVPLAANLTNNSIGAELAINIADKNLFFKDSGGTVNTVPIRQSSTSSNGWLSNTDWNTFNGKAPATSGTSLLYGNGSGGFSNVTIGSGISFAGGTLSATGSGGTVTSVTGTSPVVSSGGTTPAISLATAYGDTLNPYASKTANYILAAPNGSAGVPTFRALVAADLPSLSGTYIPYTSASSAIDLNAQTVTNIAHLGINTTSVPDILLRAFGDNNSASRIAIRGYSSNASSSSMRVAKFRGTYAAPQAPLSGDSLGKFELAGYGTTSANGYPQASYEGVATENWGATARGAKTLFYVTPNTTITQAVALTLDQDKSATFASTVTATSFSGSGSSLTGVVTNVTGTSPVVSSGGTTPAISMPAATTSVSGYLTSTDWTTFNNKGSGTVTSVAALTLGTTGTDLSSTVATGTTTPVITLNVPTASATNRGALSVADWSTFNGKQAALVSGTSIKTVGGVTLLGSGDVGTLGTGYGGTGLTSFTSGGVPYATSTSALTTGSVLKFDGTALTTTDLVLNGNQTIKASGYVLFQNSDNTNYYFIQNIGATGSGNPALSFVKGGLGEVLRIAPSGGVSIGNTTDPGATNLSVTGLVSAARFVPTSSTVATNGMYLSAANTLAFSTNSGYKGSIDSVGNLQIGQTGNPDGSSGGAIYALGSYTQTSGSAANVFITSNGLFLRSTSSLKYKKNVANAVHGLNKVMQLRPVTYQGIGLDDGDLVFGGLIAEEVDAIGLTEFVQYAKDGTPDAINYGNMVSLAFKAIQEQQAIIIDLQTRLTKAGL